LKGAFAAGRFKFGPETGNNGKFQATESKPAAPVQLKGKGVHLLDLKLPSFRLQNPSQQHRSSRKESLRAFTWEMIWT
jgi:hypothetical protein